MLKLALSFLVVIAVVLTWWLPQSRRPFACSEPIAYSIGTFDRRFDITQKEFISALAEAEAIWEQPLLGEGLSSKRNLFAYSPEEATLAVNLIYDSRQAVTEELMELESEVEENESTYVALEAKFESIKREYEILKATYELRVDALNERNATYQRRVDEWNEGPRTSKKDFQSLEEERRAINSEVDALKVFESDLNRRVSEINGMVDRLNRIARTLNLNVEDYNTIGASRGETFEGGIYFKDGEEEGINIYEFENREKLVRTLAHELGHALGLEHLDDETAIMYYVNKDDVAIASEADLMALENLCNTN